MHKTKARASNLTAEARRGNVCEKQHSQNTSVFACSSGSYQCKLRLLTFREATEHFGSYATRMSRKPKIKSLENNILQVSNAR